MNGKRILLRFDELQVANFKLLMDFDDAGYPAASTILANVHLWLFAAAHSGPERNPLVEIQELENWWYLQAKEEEREKIFYAMKLAEENRKQPKEFEENGRHFLN